MIPLLHHVGVSAAVPDHLPLLQSLQRGEAFDGPGVITMVRNAMVHATEENRVKTEALEGTHLLECSQLGLRYVELSLLAIWSTQRTMFGVVGKRGRARTRFSCRGQANIALARQQLR